MAAVVAFLKAFPAFMAALPEIVSMMTRLLDEAGLFFKNIELEKQNKKLTEAINAAKAGNTTALDDLFAGRK